MRIRFYEWLAGKLLVMSARLRARRRGPDDSHELQHIGIALMGGNSDHGPKCPIDYEVYRRFHNATFTDHQL